MKTYSETAGKPAFDWHDALKNPRKYSHAMLSELAGNWVTCACGNQCDVIPRFGAGAPMDRELYDLGSEFSCEVDSKLWEDAEETLTKIERRSLEFIAALRTETSPSDGATGAAAEIQSLPESAGQSDTPETSAFMNLIDDSEIDLGMVESKLSDFERQRDEARAERDEFHRIAKWNGDGLSETKFQLAEAKLLLIESQAGIGGDWRERRDKFVSSYLSLRSTPHPTTRASA